MTIALLLSLLVDGQGAVASCLHYEPAVVTLVGTMERKTFPGPPNYEDARNGDVAETGWHLRLPRPICLEGGGKPDNPNVAESDVRDLQLVLTAEMYAGYRQLVGQRVAVTGSLFHAITGHHHTAVLVTVKEMKRAR